MRILSCFMPASSGTARVAGYDVFRESMEVRKRIGYLPENVPLYTDMRVAPYLDFVAEVKGVPRGAAQGAGGRRHGALPASATSSTGSSASCPRATASASAWPRPSSAIPQVLILDEPTIGLDPRQITEIRALIKSLAGEHTVILSTHILPEVSMVCAAVIIINRGSIVAQGPIDTPRRAVLPDRRACRSQIDGPSAPPSARGCSGIPGVLAVTDGRRRRAAASWWRPRRGRDVRGEIFQLAAQQAWELRELRRVGMTLEEVFMRIVAGEEAPVDGVTPESGGAERRHEGVARSSRRRCGSTSPRPWPTWSSPSSCFIAGYFFFSIFGFFTQTSHAGGHEPQMGRDLNVTDGVLRPLFSNVSVILLLLMPLVTMRLFAEERRRAPWSCS